MLRRHPEFRRFVRAAIRNPTKADIIKRCNLTADFLGEPLRGPSGVQPTFRYLEKWLRVQPSTDTSAFLLRDELRALDRETQYVKADLEALAMELEQHTVVAARKRSPLPSTPSRNRLAAHEPEEIDATARAAAAVLYDTRGDPKRGLRGLHQILSDWLNTYAFGLSGIPRGVFMERIKRLKATVASLDERMGETARALEALARDARNGSLRNV